MIEPILVADIGGTNARFAVATEFDRVSGELTLTHNKTLPSADFETFSCVLKTYMSSLAVPPQRACFAVAGPRKDDTVFLTNLGWEFSISEIQEQFDFTEFKLINDFAAFAEAAPFINPSNNLTVKSGTQDKSGNIAVIGPGTGFGAAALVKGDHNVVLSCEAGHISLAPCNQFERDLIAVLSEDFEHISIEHVFSGQGLENLYRAIAKVSGVTAKSLSAPDIASLALESADPTCVKTLNQFCDWIGAVAGDLALTFNATGGVFIGGGILPRFADKLLESQFEQRFVAKGKMQHLVAEIPVTLITQENIPMLGAFASLALTES